MPVHHDDAAILHALFERQAERSPDDAAVVSGQRSITYRELDHRADQLACWLIDNGIGPDAVAGLYLGRSIEFVVGMIAILKAGGAYLPIDPELTPPERAAAILGNAGARLFLTSGRFAGKIPGEIGAPRFCLDEDWRLLDGRPEGRRSRRASKSCLAYVIYTSGSTGEPKGVMIEHRSIVNQVTWLTSKILRARPLRCLQAISVGFDAATGDFWGPLTTGGAVVLAPSSYDTSIASLRETLIRHRVNTITFASPVLSALVEGHALDGTPVRFIISGGEPLHRRLVKRCRAALPQVEIHNAYGPTEATVNATAYRADPVGSPTVPIGRPIDGVRAYVVDPAMQLVPPGSAAELAIGGAGVARGYRGRPGLTAERFRPDPFSGTPGGRLYLTGDEVRRTPDGVLEFIGRLDRQVKVRGSRIEPGEVENALMGVPGIIDAVVVARDDGYGTQLVAYVTTDGRELATAGVRAELGRGLPPYMVPARVVKLDAVPRTGGIGKIDRSALPPPGPADGLGGPPHSPPADRVDATLLSAAAAVLGRSPSDVDVRDDFFELGGDSLRAIRLAARVQAALGVELSPRVIFEHPILGDLATAVRRARQEGATPPIQPGSGAAAPLAANQKRLWFIDQLQPGNPAYNLPFVLRISGTLNLTALRYALSDIAARHESLRTVFPARNGSPYQLVLPATEAELPVEDLPGAEPGAVRRLAEQAASVPFDLVRGPLWRARLLRADVAEHYLLAVVHHIVFDTWSLGIFVDELTARYEARAAGSAAGPPSLAVQCRDIARWEQDRLNSGVVREQLGYWQRQLEGTPALLELPTDRPRPAEQVFRGADEHLTMPVSLLARLRAVCRREGLTLYMVLLAGFQVLLSRYSGQIDVVVGTSVANRSRTEFEPMVGFFVNTLPLRADLAGDQTVGQFLAQVRSRVLAAHDHSDVPFDRLVEELQPERDLSRSPLFQVLFDFESFPEPSAHGGGLDVEVIEARPETARFDLTLELTERGGMVSGALNYSTGLFDAATIRRMITHYLHLIECMTEDLDTRLSRLEILTKADREHMLVGWNSAVLDWDEDACLHELFEAAADRSPDATAVVCGSRSITFGELDKRANQLARWLIERGVGPECVVALCLDRSVEMIVGLLGVLKAGGAYLPLDPAQPIQRLSFIVEDAGTVAIVTQARYQGRFAGVLPELALDEGWGPLADLRAARPGRRCRAENMLYVIYTSGSTGEPKGVVMSHHAITRMVSALGQVIGRDAESPARVTLNAPIFFDGSVQQLGWMFQGATLIVVPQNVRQDPRLFVEFLAREQVDLLDCTPAHAELLLLYGAFGRLPRPIRALIAGEAISDDLWRQLSAGPWRAFNLYGPTETNNATACRITVGSPPIIGGPLPGYRVYVVDPESRPVPVGVPGELLIGGPGIARGYLRRPRQTAGSYIADHLSGRSGARVYRTGDLVRYRPDGALEFLGRHDSQVKIRGFRIELGEVQAALARQPSVAQCTAMIREDVPGDKRVVCYYTATSQDVGDVALMRGLRNWLPDYMIPAAVVRLETLPLTRNGKVDVRALPPPRLQAGSAADVPPGDPVEELLAKTWGEVLAVGTPPGVTDSFFLLGGHSLLAVRLVARIEELFGVTMPVRALYFDPTPRGVASALSRLTSRELLTARARAALGVESCG